MITKREFLRGDGTGYAARTTLEAEARNHSRRARELRPSAACTAGITRSL
jgi:hypothetical protein